jgi:hypothetical protein
MKEIIITEITKIVQPTTVYLIQTTPHSLFIANGIITHNKDSCNGQNDPPGCDGHDEWSVRCDWTNGDATAQTEVYLSDDNGSSYIYGPYTYSPGVTNSSTIVGSDDTKTYKCSTRHLKNGIYSGYTYSSGVAGQTNPSTYWCISACLLADTRILLVNGQEKLIQDIKEGEEIASVRIDNMSTDYNEGLLYRSKELLIHPDRTSVKVFQTPVVSEYISINNGLLETSMKHINLIKRNDEWQFMESRELQVGDIFGSIS